MIQARCRLALLIVLFCSPLSSWGAGFSEINGRQVYVDYQPAKDGQPTLVLLNGLTQSATDWDAYVAELVHRNAGLGILRFDMIGMGNTLLKGVLPVNYGIPYTDQVELTAALFQQLGLTHAYVGGLSYGGGIAIAFAVAHPEMVDQLVLMAPFTEPLKTMDETIRSEVSANRFQFPLNPASDDELYDYFLRNFIYSTYPSLEPSVMDNPYKLEGVFRMVQGIRKYDTLGSLASIVPTHLMVANQDQYIPRDALDRFWNAVPASSRRSRIDISYTEHKIPQAIPVYAAAWTTEILHQRAELNQGRSFSGDTTSLNATSGDVTIDLH